MELRQRNGRSSTEQFASSERDGAGDFAKLATGGNVAVTDTTKKDTGHAGKYTVSLVGNRVNDLDHQVTNLQGITNLCGKYHDAWRWSSQCFRSG